MVAFISYKNVYYKQKSLTNLKQNWITGVWEMCYLNKLDIIANYILHNWYYLASKQTTVISSSLIDLLHWPIFNVIDRIRKTFIFELFWGKVNEKRKKNLGERNQRFHV